jgi:osmoprotectant transport system permease protein
MTWFLDHTDDVLRLAEQHIYLAGLPLVFGLLIALPLGWVARRWRPLYLPFTAGFGLLYMIPSLALFILMPAILHRQILDTSTSSSP